MKRSTQTPPGVATLRQHGHRLTPQRQLILSTLRRDGPHLSAEAIHERVQATYPGISLSTVYRTLDVLADLDLVAELSLRGGRVYELCEEPAGHAHLVCRGCGAVVHPRGVDVAPLRAQIATASGYTAVSLNLVARGLCPRCAAAHRDRDGT